MGDVEFRGLPAAAVGRALAFSVVAAALLAACGTDPRDALVGKWAGTCSTAGQTRPPETVITQFNADGTYTDAGPTTSASGHYSIANGRLTFRSGPSDLSSSGAYSVIGDTLKIIDLTGDQPGPGSGQIINCEMRRSA
jgi:hypothetical protein